MCRVSRQVQLQQGAVRLGAQRRCTYVTSMCRNADDAVVGANIGLSAFLFRQCPGCVSEERHCWMLDMPVCVVLLQHTPQLQLSCAGARVASVRSAACVLLVCVHWLSCSLLWRGSCSAAAFCATADGCILRVCAFLCILHTHLCSSANCSQTACQMPLECMASVGRIIQTSANTGSCGDESVCCVNIRTAHPVLFGDTSCWCTV